MQPPLFVCALLCYSVVCFAHTAVFVLNTAQTPPRAPAWPLVNGICEGKASRVCIREAAELIIITIQWTLI